MAGVVTGGRNSDWGQGGGGGVSVGGKPKIKRQRSTEAEERVLMDIIYNGDKGSLRLVIVEKVTNSLISNHDNWERVWYIGIQINFNKRLRLSMTKNEDMTLIILGRRGGGRSVPPICHIEMKNENHNL